MEMQLIIFHMWLDIAQGWRPPPCLEYSSKYLEQISSVKIAILQKLGYVIFWKMQLKKRLADINAKHTCCMGHEK